MSCEDFQTGQRVQYGSMLGNVWEVRHLNHGPHEVVVQFDQWSTGEPLNIISTFDDRVSHAFFAHTPINQLICVAVSSQGTSPLVVVSE